MIRIKFEELTQINPFFNCQPLFVCPYRTNSKMIFLTTDWSGIDKLRVTAPPPPSIILWLRWVLFSRQMKKKKLPNIKKSLDSGQSNWHFSFEYQGQLNSYYILQLQSSFIPFNKNIHSSIYICWTTKLVEKGTLSISPLS